MPEPGFIDKSITHLTRYTAIARILSKYGFTDIVTAIKAKNSIAYEFEAKDEETEALKELDRWQRVRLALEELGPTYVKMGQVMSNRPDLFPQELITELEKLQDDTPTFPFEEFMKVLEQELGLLPSLVFQYIDPVPYASASLAQVHKAVLKTGEAVVIKLQRPNIIPTITTDLEMMLFTANLIETYKPDIKHVNLTGIVKGFETSIKKELSYRNEVLNIERFRKNFEDDPNVCIPKVYREYCTEHLLVMDFIGGYKISDVDRMISEGIDVKKVAKAGTHSFFKQVFIHGFFHADPHPGNMIVQSDARICYIDFGMMGYLLPHDKDYIGSMFLGINNQDPKRIVSALKKLSHTHHFPNEELLEYRLGEFVGNYALLSLGEINMGELLMTFRNIILEFKIPITPDFFLLMKAMSINEGVGLRLNPRLNVLKELKPHVEKQLRKKLSPKYISKNFYSSALDLSDLLRDLPSDIKEIIDKVKQGKLHVEIEHKGVDKLNQELDRVSNRISFAIITAALIIGSALLVHSRIPPIYKGMPVLGLLGFLVAAIFAFRLIISIWRGGKL